MASSTAKRVVLYRFGRSPLEAVVQPTEFLKASGVELISTSGALILAPYSETKAVCFGPGLEWNLFSADAVFERRPKIFGLWVRFFIRDGDQIEGVLPHNLTEWPEQGYLFVPPKAGANRQRIFIPRAALDRTELRGVIGTPVAEKLRTAKQQPKTGQLEMFD